jgi:hypothetical protein
LLIAVGLTAYAIGAGGSSKNLVLCAGKKSGALSLATAKGKCAKGEKKLTIAKEGPVGPVGATGPQGVPGAPGGTGGIEARHLVSPKTTTCAVDVGSFCVTENETCWDDENAGPPFAPVSFRKDTDGFVHLEGAYQNNSGQGACGEIDTWPVFYLPNGFRPALGTLKFLALNCADAGAVEPTWVKIEPNGRVGAYDGCVDFDGIVFHADA